MINPNETKSVFWLIIILVVAALLFGAYRYFKCKKNCKIASAPDPEAAPVETEEAEV